MFGKMAQKRMDSRVMMSAMVQIISDIVSFQRGGSTLKSVQKVSKLAIHNGETIYVTA
jgi:hypothetical protein